MDKNDDYDPYAYRVVENPLNNFEALMNLLKSVIGTGVLAMPLAFFQTGWMNGFICTTFVVIILTYALHILLQGKYMVCKWQRVPQYTFPEAMKQAAQVGPPSLRCLRYVVGIFADLFLSINHLGVCSVYIIFVTANIKEVVDYYLYEMDERIYIAILSVPVLLIMLIRSLKMLTPLVMIANLLVLAGLFVVMYYVFQGLPAISTRRPFQNPAYYPLFFGTSLFALTCLGLMLAIEMNMKNPKDYLGITGVLNQGMAIITALNCFVGFFGYWRYGDEVYGSITINLPEKDVFAQVVKIIFAVSIFLSIPLQAYVSIDIICTHYLFDIFSNTNQMLLEYIVRFWVTVFCITFAIVIPDLGLVVALVGSMFCATLTIILPAFMDLCVKYQMGYGPIKIYLIQDILLVLFGIVGTVLGVYVVIIDAIAAEKENK